MAKARDYGIVVREKHLILMYISLHSLHSIMSTTFFELQPKSLFILNFVSGFLKVKDFRSIIISHILLLRSLSDKYPWERYEPPYPPSYGLNRRMALALNNLQRLICH